MLDAMLGLRIAGKIIVSERNIKFDKLKRFQVNQRDLATIN